MDSLSVLVPRPRRAGYVGWVGHDNMGDEAMLEAWRAVLPGWRFVDVRAPGYDRMRRLARRTFLDAVVLGGGTLIGWPCHRTAVADLLSTGPELRAVALGVGVEDPEFLRNDSVLAHALEDGSGPKGTFDRELERWVELLARFECVSVRGPRSQTILGEAGLPVDIVGDPALLLADERPAGTFREGLLGMNVGVSRGLWGDEESFLDAVVEFASRMAARGWRIRFVPVWPRDRDVIDHVAARIGRVVEIVEDFQDLDRLFAAIRECHIFVGQKLHSVVFASATYVPTLALEYQPKCRDFQDSIGRGEFTVRTEDVHADRLVELADDLAERRDAHSACLVNSVGRLRGRLLEHASQIERILTREAASSAGRSANAGA